MTPFGEIDHISFMKKRIWGSVKSYKISMIDKMNDKKIKAHRLDYFENMDKQETTGFECTSKC